MIAAVFVLTLDPGYETNDDVAMQGVVDGGNGVPLPHLIFSNVVIGLMLKSLYSAAGGFPWYGLYLYLLHFAALVALLYAVLSDRRGPIRLRLLALAGVLAIFHLQMWMQLQFTSTALLLGASGLVLYAAAARDGGRRRVYFAAGLMVGLAPLVRWATLPALGLLALPVLLITLRRVPWRRQALFAATAAAVVLGASLAQAAYYQGKEEWHDYFAFNEVRGFLHQAPGLEGIEQEVLDEIGWSRNDLRMFARWFFTDESVYEIGDLRAIADSLPSTVAPGTTLGALRPLTKGADDLVRLGLIAALGAVVWVWGGRRGLGLASVTAATCAAVLLGLAVFAKLPSRVALPMLTFPAMLFLVLPQPPADPGKARSRRAAAGVRIAVVAVSAAALVVGTLTACGLDVRQREADAYLRRVLAQFEAIDPDGLFISWGAQWPLGGSALSPWRRGGLGGPAKLNLGWPTGSPMQEGWMARWGITDVYAAIALRPDVYLPLATRGLGPLYLTYLQEHYGFEGLLRPVGRAGALTVYNGAVSYEVGQGMLIERRLDGTSVAFPLDSQEISGYWLLGTKDGRGAAVVGIVPAAVQGEPIDLIVVTHRGQAVALLLPSESSLDASLGSPQFWARVPTPRQVRVFAIHEGRAAEIRPASLP